MLTLTSGPGRGFCFGIDGDIGCADAVADIGFVVIDRCICRGHRNQTNCDGGDAQNFFHFHIPFVMSFWPP